MDRSTISNNHAFGSGGGLFANDGLSVTSSTISTLSNLEMETMLENRHSLSRTVRSAVSPLSEKWGYRLGSVYIRKVAFTDSGMVDNITDKVVKRLVQVTSAMKQDGENRVGLIESETAKKVSQQLAEASAMRPAVVGRTLNELIENMTGQADRLESLNRAIDDRERRLEELHDVDAASASLSALMAAYDQRRQAVEEEFARRMEELEKETRPPRPYNDATLLAAMKNAGREIEDDSLAEAMRQTGLGTPATRAEIIEKLIRTGYVKRERKQLRSTEKGRALIGLVAGSLRSPELTAEWEQQLKEVEEGRRPAGAFYRNIVGFIRELIPQVAQGPALSPEQVAAARARQPERKGKGRKGGGSKPVGLGRCPLCKAGEIVETAKAYGCSRYRDGCRLTIWKKVAGRKLTKQQVGQLLREGRTERIEGFTSKAGKPFAARLKLGEGFKVEFDFGDEPRRVDISGSAAAPGRAGGTTASPADAFRTCL